MSHLRTDFANRDAHVYPVREDSRLLARFARTISSNDVLEIGCGRGLAAITAARTARRAVATDLNPFALAFVKEEGRRNRVRVEPVRTDLARGLGRFDLILCNPPYLPTLRSQADPDPWVDLALNGGPDGCDVFGRVIQSLGSHLRPNGRAYVLSSSRQDPAQVKAILKRFLDEGGSVEVVAAEEYSGEVLSVREFRLGRPDGG